MKKKQTKLFQFVMLFLAVLLSYSGHAQIGKVLWQENFNTLDTSVWNVIKGDGSGTPAGPGWGNQELQYYNSPNVYVSDVPGEAGNRALVLEAKAEAVGGRAFTSGKVETANKLSVKYGVVEIRARVPNLQAGLWPALWMLGTANVGWPSKGEIDIVEMGHNLGERTRQGFPNAPGNNYLGGNLIFYDAAALSPGNPTGAASIAYDVNYNTPYVSSTSIADRFLTYRMYWSSTSIRLTVVDGGTEFDLYAAPFTIGASSDEFNNPFFFLLNLAVGGTFTDATSNGQVTAPLPAKMYVDYIKVSEWNGEGTVTKGGPAPETGTYGVFTDTTPTTNKLIPGVNSDIYAWNNFAAGTTSAFEGSNVISWQTTSADAWFGGGIATRQPVDLSNFTNGNLKFRIKIPANVNFRIGVTDNYTNEKFITFPANTTKYGLVRDGNWGQVTIPIADLSGLIAFQNLNYLFAIVSDGELPGSTFQLAIDDIYYEGGGGSTIVAVTSVAMSPTTANIAVGNTTQLTGSISPTNATNQGKTWSSSNTAVATVSASGVVTGVSAGTATVTVKTIDGEKTATCAVTVTASNIAVASVAMNPVTASIAVGGTSQLTGSISPANATNQGKTWSSSNTAVATVSTSGVVTGLSAGTATVTVKTLDGAKTATCAVTVTASNIAVASVAMNPITASIAVGATRQLTGSISPTNATNKAKTWSSSNTAVATVSASGVVTGVKVGTATITVKTLDGAKTATCAVTVTASNIAVASVAMNPITASIAVGGTRQLTGSISPTNASNQGKTWLSSNTAVATVSTSGLVRAVSAGTATVTVKTLDGAKTATCLVTVTAASCTVSSANGDYTVQVGTSSSNPSLTFVPSTTNAGAGVCILYYGTSATDNLPGYIVTPNVPYTITAASGQRIYFYYTYSLPSGIENNTSANKHNFVVGSCGTLTTARQSVEKSLIGQETTAAELSVYPNPTQSELYIKNGGAGAEYVILNSNGITVLKGTGDKVDVSNLPVGLYFIKVKSTVLRFIKQ